MNRLPAVTSIPDPIEDMREYLLDVHMLDSYRIPDAWAMQSMESVADAIDVAPFRVELFILEELIDDLHTIRASGYAEGEAPYVCKVDMDDWWDQDALVGVYPYLLEGVDAVDTSCITIRVDRNGQRVKGGHGTLIFKREFLDNPAFDGDLHCCYECFVRNTIGKAIPVAEGPGLYRRRGYDSLASQWRRSKGKTNGLG